MKKAKKWILLAVIAAVVVGVFVYLWQQSRPKPVKYETQVVALSTTNPTPNNATTEPMTKRPVMRSR